MSRVVVFGLDNKAEGEIERIVDRGWMLAGNRSVEGGGETAISLTADMAAKPFLQFGRMVLISHDKLPNWAGVLDPPWNASEPLSVAAYNAEYLLSLRCPDEPAFFEGSVGAIASKIVDQLNADDDLFVRIGDVSQADPTPRQETLDGRTYWDQLKALLSRSDCEMQTRAEKDAEGRLIIYLDIARRIGMDTGFLYADGPEGNATFSDLALEGPIVNRVIGTGDESGPMSRLRTAPMVDEASGGQYRMRSEVVQFQNVREPATLEAYSKAYLAYGAQPRFSFLVNVIDKGEAFANARLGNSVLVHISKAYLPGGVQGWRGRARILAMAYTEEENLLSARLELV